MEVVRSYLEWNGEVWTLILVSLDSHQPCGKERIGWYQTYGRIDISRWVSCTLYSEP